MRPSPAGEGRVRRIGLRPRRRHLVLLAQAQAKPFGLAVLLRVVAAAFLDRPAIGRENGVVRIVAAGLQVAHVIDFVGHAAALDGRHGLFPYVRLVGGPVLHRKPHAIVLAGIDAIVGFQQQKVALREGTDDAQHDRLVGPEAPVAGKERTAVDVRDAHAQVAAVHRSAREREFPHLALLQPRRRVEEEVERPVAPHVEHELRLAGGGGGKGKLRFEPAVPQPDGRGERPARRRAAQRDIANAQAVGAAHALGARTQNV